MNSEVNPNKGEVVMKALSQQIEMLRYLWSKVESDCRSQLIWEFLFDPQQIRRRHHNEQLFQTQLNIGWQRNNEFGRF